MFVCSRSALLGVKGEQWARDTGWGSIGNETQTDLTLTRVMRRQHSDLLCYSKRTLSRCPKQLDDGLGKKYKVVHRCTREKWEHHLDMRHPPKLTMLVLGTRLLTPHEHPRH